MFRNHSADKQRSHCVCCLSSVNLEYYDAWSRDNMFLKDVAEMLDNVLQFFIDNAPEQVARAVFSAKQERSIGIGAWISCLPTEEKYSLGVCCRQGCKHATV